MGCQTRKTPGRCLAMGSLLKMGIVAIGGGGLAFSGGIGFWSFGVVLEWSLVQSSLWSFHCLGLRLA